MAFIAGIFWTNGETITKVKMDAMAANSDHLRAETEFRFLLACRIHDRQTDPDPNVTVKIDATTIATYTTSGAKLLADEDVSAYAEGLHTFVFNLDGTDFTHRWVKTADISYITMWLTVATSASNDEIFLEDLTIIGHFIPESWT